MNKNVFILIILFILIFATASFLPYLNLKESKHHPLSHAQEKVLKLYPDNDGDLLDDNIEKNETFTNITDPDSDDDYFPDGAEYKYWNEKAKLENSEELLATGDFDGDSLTNILDFDSDGDCVPDGWEVENGLSPWLSDSDFDGNSDRFEFIIYYDFNHMPITDSDNDQMPDYWENYFNVFSAESDNDGDGVTNVNEWLNGSDPTVKDERYGFQNTENEFVDTDTDGLTDRLEIAIGLNQFKNDSDSDGLFDGDEYRYWSSPFLPDTDYDNITDFDELEKNTSMYMADSDMDNLDDRIELVTDPLIPDSNNNLILDGDEFYAEDIDRDGLTNVLELDDTDGFTTDPLNPDTDKDMIIDGYEDWNHNGRRDGNDPTDSNSDWERGGETDPNNPDTDEGGLEDGIEIEQGLDPLDPSDDRPEQDYPRITPPTTPKIGLAIDPWVCFTLSLAFIIIIIAIITLYYLINYKKKFIDEVIEILEAGVRELYKLDTSDAIRNAIYKVYLDFQNSMAKFNLVRKKSMTVSEFAEIVRDNLPLSLGPVENLTKVFEEARYSDHRMGISSKNRAIKSFQSVRQELSKYRDKYLKSSVLRSSSKFVNKLSFKLAQLFKRKNRS